MGISSYSDRGHEMGPVFFVGSNLMQRYGDLEHPVEKMESSWSSWWSLLILLCAVWPQIFPSAPPNKAQLAARIVCILYTYILYIYTVTSHAEALLNMSFGGFLCNLHVVKLFMRHALPYVTQSSSMKGHNWVLFLAIACNKFLPTLHPQLRSYHWIPTEASGHSNGSNPRQYQKHSSQINDLNFRWLKHLKASENTLESRVLLFGNFSLDYIIFLKTGCTR